MTECDEWTGARNKGYGMLLLNGKAKYAHRIVWMQDNGHTDLQINHHCDNPACINIEHLYAGTHKENMRDMRERGRVNSHNAKKTHCKRGHEFTPENTKMNGDRRACRSCINSAQNRRRKNARTIQQSNSATD